MLRNVLIELFGSQYKRPVHHSACPLHQATQPALPHPIQRNEDMETPWNSSHKNAAIVKVVKVACSNQYGPGAWYVFQSFNYKPCLTTGNHPTAFMQDQYRYTLEDGVFCPDGLPCFPTWLQKEKDFEYSHYISPYIAPIWVYFNRNQVARLVKAKWIT